jgi:hypothetical protein
MEENHKNIKQESWSPGRGFNSGPLEYKAGDLTSPPQHSARKVMKGDKETEEQIVELR